MQIVSDATKAWPRDIEPILFRRTPSGSVADRKPGYSNLAPGGNAADSSQGPVDQPCPPALCRARPQRAVVNLDRRRRRTLGGDPHRTGRLVREPVRRALPRGRRRASLNWNGSPNERRPGLRSRNSCPGMLVAGALALGAAWSMAAFAREPASGSASARPPGKVIQLQVR